MKNECGCEKSVIAEDCFKQVVVVREDVKISPAKLAVQVAHACIGALDESNGMDNRMWKIQGMKKIVLGIPTQKELVDLYYKAKGEGVPCFLVIDAGYTEFDGPTLTCLGIGPASEMWIDSLTGDRKLYKGERTKKDI